MAANGSGKWNVSILMYAVPIGKKKEYVHNYTDVELALL